MIIDKLSNIAFRKHPETTKKAKTFIFVHFDVFGRFRDKNKIHNDKFKPERMRNLNEINMLKGEE